MKALFVYTTESQTGLSGKALKIEEGFRKAGCELTSLYFVDTAKKRARARGWLVLQLAYLREMVRGGHDVIYIRYAYYFIGLYLISLVMRRPVQIEINGNSQVELLASGQRFRATIDRWVEATAVRASRRVHVVSTELQRSLQKKYPNVEVVFNPNFVVDEVPCSTRSLNASTRVNLVFLGNAAQPWHGMDKFIVAVLARNEWFSNNCHLHCVGNVTETFRELVRTHDLSSRVTFYGFLIGDAKASLLSEMDIGLGCFNLKVKGLSETTSIKNGEYLHAGMALLLGYADAAIPPTLPFVEVIDVDDPAASRERLRLFVDRLRDARDIKAQAHRYARTHLLVRDYIQKIMAV